MKLTEKQKGVIDSDGNLLVIGGPGSGKTTVSIIKASKIVEQQLRPGQKVLFLSFARATVSRVIETIESEQHIPREQKRRINVETYHSFFWRIIKAHGYLVDLPRKLSILLPPNVMIALSTIRDTYSVESKLTEDEIREKHELEDNELLRIAHSEGNICFDLFAKFTTQILQGSERIRRLIATMYPVIILDEFQDTNPDQWDVVQALGQHCGMIALADPEQRIFDWIGADPKRLDHFENVFSPTKIDLSSENHRNGGTDILRFGNDILKGKFRKGSYKGVKRLSYETYANLPWTKLITTTYIARKRLVDSGQKNWSLAVLVPTKKMTRFVSDNFRNPPAKLSPIMHTASIDMEAAILGAEIIAFLMQPDNDGNHFATFITLLQNYYYGKGGNEPTKGDLKEAKTIQNAYDLYISRIDSGKSIHKKSILVSMLDVYKRTRATTLTGDPDKDWRAITKILGQGACKRLKKVSQEVRNVRLLDRGVQLHQALSQDWRDTGAYTNALSITQEAFVREYFSTNYKPEAGVVVMNMHKAKGKQFDEVIIFEGWPRIAKRKIVANPDRIVWSNSPDNDNEQARYNFRVSVTRGKCRTTILTPKSDPCILLFNRK